MTTLFFLTFLVLLIAGVVLCLIRFAEDGPEFHPNIRGAPLLAVAGGFLLMAMSWVTVDAGSVGVVKLFGNPYEQLTAGGHFIHPLATVTPIAVQRRIVAVQEDAASHDLQIVHIQVTVAYHVDPTYATSVLVDLNDEADIRVLNPTLLEAIKAVTALYDVQELIGQRAKVRDGIDQIITQKIGVKHLVTEQVAITDFKFSKMYEDSIEAKVTAEQNSEKAENDLKRIKIEAQQQIEQSKGEAEALRAQKEQITPELLQLRTVEMMKEKWDGHLPENYYGGTAPLPMMEVLKTAPGGRPRQ
jgi:regulator of protease activity HflC (stomatin/prohibitin superfamily)